LLTNCPNSELLIQLQVSNYQQKLKQLDGRQQELVRDNSELKDLCLYLDEERNFAEDLSCPHCGQKILSRPNSVVPTEADEAELVEQRMMDHTGN
jgi:DNA-directed RNA polymerase subunit RPC12/RpoP